MKNTKVLLLCLITCIALFSACNPDCETYGSVQTEITPNTALPGEQVLVKTNPSDFLKDRDLYVQRKVDNTVSYEKLDSKYIEEAGGSRATMPMEADVTGIQSLFIEDTDCGGFISLNSLRVADEGYVNTNPGMFVIPSPPIVIVPSPPIPSPSPVVNTWFSPDDPAYCIWFNPVMDTIFDAQTGNIVCINESTTLLSGDTLALPPAGPASAELHCSFDDDLNQHGNPVTGFIDKSTGYVDITINRELKGLGKERYIGHIAEVSSFPENYRKGSFCGLSSPETTGNIMILTSQTTQRQLVLYRYLNANATPPDNLICN